jgi:hypothetical protein
MSVTLTKFKDKTLQLTHKVRISASSKMEGTELSEFMAFVFSFRSGIDYLHAKSTPLQRVSTKVIEHCPNIDIPLF